MPGAFKPIEMLFRFIAGSDAQAAETFQAPLKLLLHSSAPLGSSFVSATWNHSCSLFVSLWPSHIPSPQILDFFSYL